MKTYMGVPGEPPLVTVTNGADTKPLEADKPFGWGKGGYLGGSVLAKAILTDHLGDAVQAQKLASRFMWRSIVALDPMKPWTMTEREVAQQVAELQLATADAARIASRIASEPVPIASEGGIGPGGSPLSKVENKG